MPRCGRGSHVRPLLTTIGSFPPLEGSPESMLQQVVEMQRGHRLDVFTDGEQRGDILSMYARLPGLGTAGGMPRVVGRIRPLEDPAGFEKVRDLEFLRRAFPDAKFKVGLTGPATFFLACVSGGVGPAYRGPLDPAMYDDLTEAIAPIAHEIAHRGAMLQIDEPILSQGMRDYGPALGRLDRIAAEASREAVSIHVCGGLVRSRALDALFRLERVGTLNLAFAGRAERENRALLSAGPWEEHDLRLGAGCVDVQVARPEEVMTPQAVAEVLRQILGRVGRGHLGFVLPDCGFRATPPSLVPGLLKSLVDGFGEVFLEAS